MTKRDLTRLVLWAQQLLAEVLHPGDLAVDLTAGTGRDTLFLAQQVGPAGAVLAFDIQEDALRRSAELLQEEEIPFSLHSASSAPVALDGGVHLLHASHDRLSELLPRPPAAIIANLGYLPGSDQGLTTARETTLAALQQARDHLREGGRLAVVAYIAHPGGREEADAVEALFAKLPADQWQVLRLSVANLPHAPFLLVAERRRRTGRSGPVPLKEGGQS